MKITSFDPVIVTPDADSVKQVFEDLGFEKKHAPVTSVEQGEVHSYRLKHPEGYHVDVAATLLDKVQSWVDSRAKKTQEELGFNVSWCEKMLRRAERADAEGCFRRHWLLTDSLEIYTELRGWPYLGPKKALAQLEKKDKAVFALYETALTAGDYESLAAWVEHIRERFEKGQKKRKKA